MARAAIYVRISRDTEGTGLGVARQEADCRELALRLGVQVIEPVYRDNDISAYSGKLRPAYESLLADMRAGLVDVVLAWHTDRLHRSPVELEEYIKVSDAGAISTHCVKAGALDLSTPGGRAIARTLGAWARYESEHKSERIRRQRRAGAQAGQIPGGAPGYGYSTVGSGPDRTYAVVESEAAVIRECAARVLAGETTTSVIKDLNDRGITTRVGRPWLVQRLSAVLLTARISGRREHIPDAAHRGRGEARPLVGEITATDCWPAIITPEDSDRLRRLLTNPARRTTTGPARKYLLSGILTCHCGSRMGGRVASGNKRATYFCVAYGSGIDNRPGHVTTDAQCTDDYVTNRVLIALSSRTAVATLNQPAGAPENLHARIRTEQDALEALAAEHGNGGITLAEWKAARAPIAARVADLAEQLARRAETDALSGFLGPEGEIRAQWSAANLAQRRAVISAVFERIAVHPATRGRKSFDGSRFEALWRM